MESLDKGLGACVLLAKIVVDNLLYFNGDRYHIGDFVIMPNHVHLLVCLLGDTDLLKQCRRGKSSPQVRLIKCLDKRDGFGRKRSITEQFCARQKNPSQEW